MIALSNVDLPVFGLPKITTFPFFGVDINLSFTRAILPIFKSNY